MYDFIVPVSRFFLYLAMAAALPGAGSSALWAQDADPIPGVVRFTADHTKVGMPGGVDALIFDTSAIGIDWASFQQIGGLVVDSITRYGVTEPVIEQSQMEGISIASGGLLARMEQHKVRVLKRSFPGAIPNDTLVYNPIREKWFPVPDRSKSYTIHFGEDIDVATVFEELQQVSDIGGVELRYVPVSFAEPWVPNDPLFDEHQWSLQEYNRGTNSYGINAVKAWNRLPAPRGEVPIAIVDGGGVLPHLDVEFKRIGGDGGLYIGEHGLGVSGVALAVTNNAFGMAGVAPDGQLLSYCFVCGGIEPWNDIIDACADGAHVINMSWGYSPGVVSEDLANACAWAHSQGVVLVAAAGNDKFSEFPYVTIPAAYNEWVIAVGAVAADGDIWEQSNYGCPECANSVPSFVDIIAPGEKITIPYWDPPNSFLLDIVSGTSLSAPMVAGAVALARGYDPKLPISRITDALLGTAILEDWDDTMKCGAGRLDMAAFIEEIVNTSAPSPQDSVPCLIIATMDNAGPMMELRDIKKRRGTYTEVMLLNSLWTLYPGADTPEKIRNCIKDYHENRHLEYVILAGDESRLMPRFVHQDIRGPGIDFVSDLYYACLDGNWDADGDGIYGEVEDDVDLIPEIAVGRLPFSTPEQFDNFVGKLLEYESGTGSDWRTKALFLGSKMFQPGDGPELCENIRSIFPSEFTTEGLYDGTYATAWDTSYFRAMNDGQGIVVKYCGASDEFNFAVRRSSVIQYLYNEDIDTLANHGRPSVIFASTCWNNRLELDCIAEHYMAHPTGGAVAYIGSSYNDFVFTSRNLTTEFFSGLFSDGPREIGKLFNRARSALEPKSHWDGSPRHTVLSYSLCGDPQMRIWSGAPMFFTQQHAGSYPYGLDITINNYVTDQATGEKVRDAVVCLMKDDEVYEVGVTDPAGRVDFAVNFPSAGFATITAGKDGYVFDVDTIEIVESVPDPPSCPVLFVHDGTDYQMENPLLTACEEKGYRETVADNYVVTSIVGAKDGIAKFQLRELEDEITYVEHVELATVDHSTSTRIACADAGEVLVYEKAATPPTSATDQEGNDRLRLLTATDGRLFAANETGYLIVTFPQGRDKVAVLLSGGAKEQCGNPPIDGVSLSGIEPSGRTNLTVELLTEAGSWEEVASISPRTNVTEVLQPIYRPITDENNEMTLRISWHDHYVTDMISLHNLSEEKSEVNHWQVSRSALKSQGSLFEPDPEYSAMSPLQLRKGDVYEFEFESGHEPSKAVVRDYIIRAVGRYEPDFAVYSRTVPKHFRLFNNYPNPFNPVTEIQFAIPRAGQAKIEVFNIAGQKVATLVDGHLEAGYHTVTWDGQEAASGVYLYRLMAGDFVESKKMLLVK